MRVMSEAAAPRPQTRPMSAQAESGGFSDAAQAASAQTSRWSKRLLTTFVMLAALCLAAQVILWVGMSGGISEGMHVQEATDGAFQPVNPSQARGVYRSSGTYLVILMAVTIGCFGVILYLFMKKVVVPLRRVTAVLSEIAGGNLGVTVPSSLRHEMGDLGQMVNDVAANFQEVLLLTGTTVGNVRCSLEAMEKLSKSEGNPDEQSGLQEHLEAAKRDVDCLGVAVKSFTFYQTSFSGWDVKHACPEDLSE
jgi:methyl-accepting chemotaxis protein